MDVDGTDGQSTDGRRQNGQNMNSSYKKNDQLHNLQKDLPDELRSYITYSQMQQIESSIAEILHKIIDLYMESRSGPGENNIN